MEAWHLEESPGEAIGKMQSSCGKRPQHFGDAGTRGRPPRTAAAVEKMILLCYEWLFKPSGGARKMVSGFQMSDAELSMQPQFVLTPFRL